MITLYPSKKTSHFFGSLLLITSFLSSCSKDDSTPSATSEDSRNRYLGSWLCVENGTTSFTINITKKGIADTLLIDNFSGYGSTAPLAYAIVNGNSMTIPTQNITITAVPIISGSGIMNSAGNKITMNYKADGNVITATCTH